MFLIRWLTAPIRLGLKLVFFVVTCLVVYYLVTLAQVWLTSRHYDPVHAQAIVVMGAAQYDGVPSPDLASRLDEALLLYREGYAHLVVCTGSKEPGDVYTEAESGARYLESQGVPSSQILKGGGRDTWANLESAAALLAPKGAANVLIVTDPFHEDRSMAIATDVGLNPHPAPTRTSPITGGSVVPYFLSTAGAVALGRVVGYQHVHELGKLTGTGTVLGYARGAP